MVEVEEEQEKTERERARKIAEHARCGAIMAHAVNVRCAAIMAPLSV